MPDSAAILAYLAGFFDGEGTIALSESSLHINVAQVDPAPLQKLVNAFGGSVRIKKSTGNPRHRTVSTWDLSSTKAANALEAMLPYLWVKRDEAVIALGFYHNQQTKSGHYLTDDEKSVRQSQIETVRYLKHRSHAAASA
jgi:hypothetical protein